MAGAAGYNENLVRVSGYVVGVVVVASVFVSRPSSAILFKSTADPTYNTSAPTGALANSGWQYEGSWGSYLGTAIAPNFFLAAHHIGGATGEVFVLNGFTYHTTAFFDDSSSDLRLWQVAETFPSYASLYTNTDEVGKHCLVFGRGTQRGPAVIVSGVTNGWQWGAGDGVERWGENDVATNVNGGATLGDFLYPTFDRGAGSNECDLSVGDSSGAMFIQTGSVWQLAGIHYAVDGPFSNAVDDTEFDAALLDRGGLYQANGTNWVFIPNIAQDQPSGFYSTRVSSHVAWINSVISSNSPVAPAASFNATPTSGLWPLTVTFTDTSTGTLTNRFWDFGDGTTINTLSNILTHTYTLAGTYTVTLIVSGPAGDSTNTQANLVVALNPPQLSVQPSRIDFGLMVSGQSSNQQFLVINTGDETLTGTAQVSAGGSPFAVTGGSPFTVNGGQTGLVTVAFSPVAVGAFTNSVEFASNGGASTNTVTGSTAVVPIANFTATPTNGAATLLVNFTDASTGTVTGWAWVFGDGGTSILASPSYSYVNTGTFSVSLTVFGPLGSNTLSLANYITVTNLLGAPVAAFTASPMRGAAPLLVNFTDASVGTITNHSWTFGDGSTSGAVSPTYTYSNAGVYSVTLAVSGPSGSGATNLVNLITVTNIVIVPPPVAAFTANPVVGAAPLLVNFTDASTGTITNYSWTFGDGNTSGAVSPTYTYSTAGVYSVTLAISGPGGSSMTNLANLITVTNTVNVPPTVAIARPAKGMLYPTVTNLTITIVASATSNDGASISKIEFFDDDTKLGETTSNPGTNFLVNPAPGVHVLSARASDTFGKTNISAGTMITVGAKNSPLGDWEITTSGADKGAQFLTFEDDFSASGFGIRLKTFGLDDVSGHWSFNAKGQVTGPFLEQIGSTTSWTGTLLGTAKSPKTLTATVPTASGIFHWKGIPATTFPDLSGTWTGLVTVVKTSTAVSYRITNDAAVFDIATSADPATVVGRLLVTSRNSVYGYVTFDGKPINFSGTFSASRLSLTLKGKDATMEKVSIKIFR
jgi:PKD repeat protein